MAAANVGNQWCCVAVSPTGPGAGADPACAAPSSILMIRTIEIAGTAAVSAQVRGGARHCCWYKLLNVGRSRAQAQQRSPPRACMVQESRSTRKTNHEGRPSKPSPIQYTRVQHTGTHVVQTHPGRLVSSKSHVLKRIVQGHVPWTLSRVTRKTMQNVRTLPAASNAVTLQRCQMPSIASMLQQRRLRWLGHVGRMADCSYL